MTKAQDNLPQTNQGKPQLANHKLPPKVKLSRVVLHKKINRVDSQKSYQLDKSEGSIKSNTQKTPQSRSSSNKTSYVNTPSRRVSKKTNQKQQQMQKTQKAASMKNLIEIPKVQNQLKDTQQMNILFPKLSDDLEFKDFRLEQKKKLIAQGINKRLYKNFVSIQTKEDLLLFRNPAITSDTLAQIAKGTIVQVDFNQKGFWVQVLIREQLGWMLRKNFTKFQETLKKKVTAVVIPNEQDAQQSEKEKSKTNSLKTESETNSNTTSSEFYSDDPEAVSPLKKRETLKNGYQNALKQHRNTQKNNLQFVSLCKQPKNIYLTRQPTHIIKSEKPYLLLEAGPVDKANIFQKYQESRRQELIKRDGFKFFKYQTISNEKLSKIKNEIYDKIVYLRSNDFIQKSEEELTKIRLKMKFVKFMFNKQIRGAFKTWQDKLKGQYYDQRWVILMREQKLNCRQKLYDPVIQQRRSIKEIQFELKCRNQRSAQTIKKQLSDLKLKY